MGSWIQVGIKVQKLSKDLMDREAMSLLCGFTGEPKEVSPVGVSRPKIPRFGVG
jgi:hypothetical protein